MLSFAEETLKCSVLLKTLKFAVLQKTPLLSGTGPRVKRFCTNGDMGTTNGDTGTTNGDTRRPLTVTHGDQ